MIIKTVKIATGALVVLILVFGAYQFGLNSGRGTPELSSGKIPGKPAGIIVPSPPEASQNAPSPVTAGNDKFTHFRVGNRNIKSIYTEENTVWVGTSGGVIRYDTRTDEHRVYDVKNGLLANGVFYVGRLNGQIHVGTYGGGLAVYNEALEKFDIFNIPQGLADAFVYDVILMPNGDYWIATWSGANRVVGGDLRDPSKWETYTVENTNGGLPNDWVYGLAEGKNGEVWLATEGGLARYMNDKWDHWNHKDGQGARYELVKDDNKFDTDPASMSSHHARQKVEMDLQHVSTAYNPNYIVALEVDHEGAVWIGTWGAGLSKFDGKSFKNFTVKEGLPSNHVFMLHEDVNQQLWIGTSDGLATFSERGGFDIMTTNDGLFANTVFSMATENGNNNLWIGSFGGVARITRQ